ncbi:transglutaminase domain-containing protein [Candidatus Woesearchaeota archaeon]|nr:transglutaminase domain-containing protein [Candidatus Woesearchaeota archaeon]
MAELEVDGHQKTGVDAKPFLLTGFPTYVFPAESGDTFVSFIGPYKTPLVRIRLTDTEPIGLESLAQLITAANGSRNGGGNEAGKPYERVKGLYRGEIDPSKVAKLTQEELTDSGLEQFLRADLGMIGAAHDYQNFVNFRKAIEEISKGLPAEHRRNPVYIISGILNWIGRNIEETQFTRHKDAHSTISRQLGGSEAIANTYTVLAQSFGVPTMTLSGIALRDGEYSPHTWAKSHLHPYGWVEVNPTLGQFGRVKIDPALQLAHKPFDYAIHGYLLKIVPEKARAISARAANYQAEGPAGIGLPQTQKSLTAA